MEIKNKKTFEKKFKEAVPNFDENRIWFEYKGTETKICFLLYGILRKLEIFKDDYYIEIWKNYFIEYLETGNFDYNGYWRVYKNGRGNYIDDKVYKFSMVENKYGNFFAVHSPEFSKFMSDYRYEHGDSGFEQVPKPDIVIRHKIYKELESNLITKEEMFDFINWIYDSDFKKCANNEWIKLGTGGYNVVANSTEELYKEFKKINK